LRGRAKRAHERGAELTREWFCFPGERTQGWPPLAGEDTELCFALRASGWRFWYDDDLLLKHFIPKARLQWTYALGLMRGIGECSTLIAIYLIALDRHPTRIIPVGRRPGSFSSRKRSDNSSPFSDFILGTPWKTSGLTYGAAMEMIKSQLGSLWKLRTDYFQLQEQIRGAAWVKGDSWTAA